MICITEDKLLKLLQSKTLRKVFEVIIDFDSTNSEVTVRDLTKCLHYKNKSTVSRALKTLRKEGYIDKDNNLKRILVIDHVIF